MFRWSNDAVNNEVKNSKQKQANDATTKYKTNWNNWQKYYDEARISGSHVGSRYTAWVNAWRADLRASRLARHPVMVYLSVAC